MQSGESICAHLCLPTHSLEGNTWHSRSERLPGLPEPVTGTTTGNQQDGSDFKEARCASYLESAHVLPLGVPPLYAERDLLPG